MRGALSSRHHGHLMSQRPDILRSSRQNRLLGPGPRHVGVKVRALTNPLLKSRGLAQGDIVFRWQEIVGPELAAFCYPVKLTHGRGGQGGILMVRVAGAAALEFEYLIPQVMERINTFYGWPAVARIKIEQGPLPREARKREKRLRALSDSEEKALEHSLEKVQNTQLKDRLAELGRLIKASHNK